MQDTILEAQEIHLKGDLRVANLADIKQQLLDELLGMQHLHVRISNVHALDLSTLQWVYAFGCAASSEGKEVTIKMELPADLEKLVRVSGIKKMFNRFEN
ncbi:MAG: STAS domain-containing protein [Tunicatimonas sp.]